ncbi:MAG: hypothetical protein ACJZ17_04140 [Acidimicrobiales bacterium]
MSDIETFSNYLLEETGLATVSTTQDRWKGPLNCRQLWDDRSIHLRAILVWHLFQVVMPPA